MSKSKADQRVKGSHLLLSNIGQNKKVEFKLQKGVIIETSPCFVFVFYLKEEDSGLLLIYTVSYVNLK